MCGIEFERKKSQIKKNNYCSKACLGKANAERYKKKRIQMCDNCFETYENRNRHKKRNNNFFCSKKCANEFRTKKKFVRCDWCNKQIYRKSSDIKRNRHNFCDIGCYIDYVNFDKSTVNDKIVCGKKLYRLIVESHIGRSLASHEQIHHIDGNHDNNNIENLVILSCSEHSKIHAAEKERDLHGKFIK